MSMHAAASVSEALRSRVKSSWSQRYRDLITDTLSRFDSLRAKRNEVSGDRDLTTEGKGKRIRDYVFNEVGENLGKATRSVNRMRKTVANERTAAVLKATGGELDAVGLAICAAVKNLSQADLAALTFGPDADRRVIQAVLNAPALLTGVSPQLRSQIEADFISQHASDELAKIIYSEEAIEMAETCVGVLKSELIEALDMTLPAFDAWFGEEFAPTEAELRAEDSDFATREADAVREAAGRLTIRQRVQLVEMLREQNAADMQKPFDPVTWGSELATL